jgi:hypothetical protein
MKTDNAGRSQYFNAKRFFLIMKRDVLTHYRTVLVSFLAVGGFALFASTVSMFNRSQGNFHLIFYLLTLFVSGFIFTSRVFREIYTPVKSYTYVTLPGSQLEKYVERWFLSSIGYVLGTFAAYYVIVLASAGLNQLIFGYSHGFLNPAQKPFLIGASVFLVLQSLFFAGAVYFKKHPLIKTLLMVALAAFVLMVIALVAARMIIPDYFEIQARTGAGISSPRELATLLGLTEEGLETLGRSLWLALRIIFWAILAPACWVLSFLKFRKIEV